MSRAAHIRNLFGPLVRRMYRIHVHGSSSVPLTGPVLLLCPQEGILAVPAFISVTPRPVHVIPNASLARVIGSSGIESIGGIPISGFAAIETQNRAATALKSGAAVGIFGGNPSPGWLVAKEAPVVVPVIVVGDRGRVLTDPPRLGSQVDVFFGPASIPSGMGENGRQAVAPNRSEARFRAEWCRQIVMDAQERAIQRTGGSQ
jgi:hypothetical protein